MTDVWTDGRWAALTDPAPNDPRLRQFWKSVENLRLSPDSPAVMDFLNDVWAYLAFDELGIRERAHALGTAEKKLFKKIDSLYGDHLPAWIDPDKYRRARGCVNDEADLLTRVACKHKQTTECAAADYFVACARARLGTPAYNAVVALVGFFFGVDIDPESLRRRA